MLPKGLPYNSRAQPVHNLKLLTDITYLDNRGQRCCQQQIFNEVFSIIAGARQFILLDMFLYNPFRGIDAEPHRALSEELTSTLLQAKQQYPALFILVITDPINTVYGGVRSAQFERLAAAGIDVVETNLDALPDSNALYSFFWRGLRKVLKRQHGGLLPNPFGEGRVSLFSYLAMFNFKANHRKVLVADDGSDWVGLVTSGNPHDGSSAHHNQAVRFSGRAVLDLLRSELPVLDSSNPEQGLSKRLERLITHYQETAIDNPVQSEQGTTLQVVTEKCIKEAVLKCITRCRAGDLIVLVMFYLSDREIIETLKQAHLRQVQVRVLLDPNKDAFGFPKKGIPNRPVAWELAESGIAVRWCDTHGEQCHTKMMYVQSATERRASLISGSANFTRRNLENFNLETDVVVTGNDHSPFFNQVSEYVETLWCNATGMRISAEYELYAEHSAIKRTLYRLMEATGISTF